MSRFCSYFFKYFRNNKGHVDNDEDAIVLSDTESIKDSDSDSDDGSDIMMQVFFSEVIYFILIVVMFSIDKNKRKRSDTDKNENENENTPLKKGRRNIKKVLDDSELQEETQIADLEEELRKERISMKNKSVSVSSI